MKTENKDIATSSGSEGFTLIEMAIVLMISGMIMLVGAGLLKIYVHQERFERTIENVEMVQDAMTEFYALHGRYPCPADPSLPPTDANYGIEQCRANPDVDPCPAGVFCTVTGTRDANGDLNNDPVMIGMIPVRTMLALDATGNPLGIIDTLFVDLHTRDGFDTRLTYAVSEYMTNIAYDMSNPANNHWGAIAVIDENNISVVDPAGSAHYIVVSHGDNRAGGYTNNGGNPLPTCWYGVNFGDPPGPAAPGLDTDNAPREIENCDYNDGIFRQGIRSLVEGRNYNDDVLYYEIAGLSSLWRRVLSETQPGVSFITNTNLENVGVGEANPVEKLHVSDDLSAENNVIADKYCLEDDVGPDPLDSTNERSEQRTCFESSVVAGSDPNMECPDGQVAYAIGDDDVDDNDFVKIYCRPVFDTAPTGQACAPGEFVTGLRYTVAGGTTIICNPL